MDARMHLTWAGSASVMEGMLWKKAVGEAPLTHLYHETIAFYSTLGSIYGMFHVQLLRLLSIYHF